MSLQVSCARGGAAVVWYGLSSVNFPFYFLSLLPKYLGVMSNTANELYAHTGNCLRKYTMSVQLSQLLIYLPSFVLSCQGQLPQRTVFLKNQWLKGAWRSC